MSHRASRQLQVSGLARVEGEGALDVTVRDGQVDHVALRIYEPPRFFEAFLRGRKFTEPPDRPTPASAASTGSPPGPGWRRWPNGCATPWTTRSRPPNGCPHSTFPTFPLSTNCLPCTSPATTRSRRARPEPRRDRAGRSRTTPPTWSRN